MMNNETRFAFLRFSLDIIDEKTLNSEGFFDDANWDELYAFAMKQTLVGVFADGIKRLPKGPTEDQVMDWIGQQVKIQRQNTRLNNACVNVYNKLRDLGYNSCILKGQGNALLYPNFYARTSGDIDLWVDGTRNDIRKLAHQLVGANGHVGEESYNHIELDVDGVAVELHYTPAFMNSYSHNKKLQAWMRCESAIQFKNKVLLPDTNAHISIPTIEFNLVYQLVHLFHHVFFEGIGLRQMVDYYYVLVHSNHEDIMKAQETIKRLGLWKFAGAVMYVLHQVLNVDVHKMIAPMDGKRGEMMLSDILQGGNFGKFGHKENENKQGVQHNLLRLKRDIQLTKYYPSEALCEPWFRMWHYLWRKNRCK